MSFYWVSTVLASLIIIIISIVIPTFVSTFNITIIIINIYLHYHITSCSSALTSDHLKVHKRTSSTQAQKQWHGYLSSKTLTLCSGRSYERRLSSSSSSSASSSPLSSPHLWITLMAYLLQLHIAWRQPWHRALGDSTAAWASSVWPGCPHSDPTPCPAGSTCGWYERHCLTIFHFKNLSCMVLNAISVFGKVKKWSPEKCVLQKHH